MITKVRGLMRGDISPISRPDISAVDWHDPPVAVDQLRTWAEARAVETIRWYLRDKQAKRWASRFLRLAAVGLAVAGGVMPLLSTSSQGPGRNLGYAFL